MSFRRDDSIGDRMGDALDNVKIPKFKMSKKGWIAGAVVIGTIAIVPLTIGINDAGYRTVIQYPWGSLSVKFSPGLYSHFFGSTETYPDVASFDFDEASAGGEALIDTSGIKVRYQDGGTGTIYGKARFILPNDEETMLKAHKAFNTKQGLAQKLLKPVTEESQNLTAGLLTSEGAYAEQRGTYIEWSLDQLENGKYRTILQGKQIEDETGEKEWKQVPVIALEEDNITPKRLGSSDLTDYGITVSGYQITNWGFEPKTLEQISAKREATMAIITAKANAERAKQDKITAKEEGLKNVEIAKYEKEVEKQKAVTEAEQKKEVAILGAQQMVDVAKQIKLEAEQKKEAAIEYKQEQILIGEGESERKRLVLEADGALEQKLAAYKEVMMGFAKAVGQQKWVPEVMMGGGTSGGEQVNSAQQLIDMFAVKTAKDLQLDMNITGSQAISPPQMNAPTQ